MRPKALAITPTDWPPATFPGPGRAPYRPDSADRPVGAGEVFALRDFPIRHIHRPPWIPPDRARGACYRTERTSRRGEGRCRPAPRGGSPAGGRLSSSCHGPALLLSCDRPPHPITPQMTEGEGARALRRVRAVGWLRAMRRVDDRLLQRSRLAALTAPPVKCASRRTISRLGLPLPPPQSRSINRKERVFETLQSISISSGFFSPSGDQQSVHLRDCS